MAPARIAIAMAFALLLLSGCSGGSGGGASEGNTEAPQSTERSAERPAEQPTAPSGGGSQNPTTPGTPAPGTPPAPPGNPPAQPPGNPPAQPPAAKPFTLTFSWTVPHVRVDGTPLSLQEIDRYEIYYQDIGSRRFGNVIKIAPTDSNGNPVQSYQLQVNPGQYFFGIACVDKNNQSSNVSKVIPLTLP